MDALTLVLLLIISVLISAVVEQVVTRLSLPLIQIALGVVVAFLLPGGVGISLDPNLFMVLLVAPLLYDEAKNTDKIALWKELNPVLSLAVGLVVVSTLVVGFAVNLIIPSIPLAVAFALGAALSPTDVVAVTSLAKQVDIPKRRKSILESESMLNDATGIVSFQFALAAAVTGSFSVLSASVSFAFSFAGGVIVGLVLGLALNFLLRAIRSIGVEGTTFHVLFEVLTPFVVYLVAVELGVSGIIAVMMAGLTNVISPRTLDPSVSRMNIVSSSVWRVLSFAMNGIVFVLLGTQLPGAMRRTWGDVSFDNGFLIVCILGITLLIYAVRFLWTLAMDWDYARRKEKRGLGGADVKMALVTTLCGAKGTITLSVLFTLPYAVSLAPFEEFPQRDLVIFLACGVIVVTLLVANFVVPLLSPRERLEESELERRQREAQCRVDVLIGVIEGLAARQTEETRASTQAVIATYQARLASIKESHGIDDAPNAQLRLRALGWEQEKVLAILDEERQDYQPVVCYRHLARLAREESLIRHKGGWTLRFRELWTRSRTKVRRSALRVVRDIPDMTITERAEQARRLQIEVDRYVIERLEELVAEDGSVSTEDVVSLLLEYQGSYEALVRRSFAADAAFDIDDGVREVRRLGLSLELEQIQRAFEEGRLSRASAKRMRDNVHLMQMDLEDRL